MNYYQPHQPEPPPTNHTGTVGFALALLSYLTCGILAIPAAVISLAALFTDPEKPKTLAIIGLILCLPSLLLGFVVMFFVVGAAGVMSTARARVQQREMQDEQELIRAQQPPKEIRIQAGEGEVIYTEPVVPTAKPYGSRPGARFTVGPPQDN